MRTIDVTHSALKVRTWVMVDKIFYIYTSATNGCTHIVSDSGVICPTTESEAQILALIANATTPKLGKEANQDGTSKQTP